MEGTDIRYNALIVHILKGIIAVNIRHVEIGLSDFNILGMNHIKLQSMELNLMSEEKRLQWALLG